MKSTIIFRALLALFGLALCISISAAEACAGLLLIWWFVTLARTDKNSFWKPSPLSIPVVTFFVWTVLCVLVQRPADYRNAVTASSAFILLLWSSQRLNASEVNWLFRWVCIGATVAALIGVLQVLSGINYLPNEKIYRTPARFEHWPNALIHIFAVRNDRAVGPRSHPLTYAECLMPAFFLLMHAVARLWSERTEKFRWLLASVVGFLIVAAGIFVSQSRGVWIGVFIGMVVYSAARGRHFFVRAVGIGVVFGGILFAAAPASMQGRLLSVVSLHAGSVGDQASKQTRFELWREAGKQIRQTPLMGVGFDGVHLLVNQPFEPEPRVWTETHNMYLQFLLETGVIGLGLLLWLLFVCARVLWATPLFWRPALLGMFGAFMIAGLTESWMRDKEVAMLFWLFIGCADVLRRHEKV